MKLDSPTSSVQQIAEHFVHFAEETRNSSPLYSALSTIIAGDRELLGLLLAASPMQRWANLLFAAVHDLLLTGIDHPAARYYPSIVDTPLPPDHSAFDAFHDLCLSHRSALAETIAKRHTQTNEVGRTIAFLPVVQRLAVKEPIALVEVGASAGLNLLMDRFRYRYGEGPWVGVPDSPVAIRCELRSHGLPVQREPPRIAFRVGLDSDPLDVHNRNDARWLMACVWPEEIDRMQLLRAAMDVAKRSPPRIVRGHAVETLEAIMTEVPDDLAICLFHSATLPYLTVLERTAFVSTIDAIGRGRRLHWLSLEGGAPHSMGTELPFNRLYVPRPDDRPSDILGLLGYASWNEGMRQDRLLARVDMHGKWIEWIEGE